jgi:DNA-binding CsgD family transcriptional regulator
LHNASRPGETLVAADVIEQLLRLRRGDNTAARCAVIIDGRQLECSFVSTLGADELLFRVSDARVPSDDAGTLQRVFSLTAREAEVLLWISRGKPNRDIGEILAISPRTVNKHLEQVFVKVGVENRSAAAAAAIRSLVR